MNKPIESKAPGRGKDQHLATLIQPAKLEWKNSDTPVSQSFDDVYYSSDNGLEETRYVFLKHNQLTERWQALDDKENTTFAIAETGFGTGLNFLATCEAWANSGTKNATLHFVSVEKHPLTKTDLIKSLTPWTKLKRFADHLIAQYPPLVTGFHRIEFPELRIKLTLIFDDAIAGFNKLDADIDAWFLDGFAPSKNPDMWQPELFQQIKRLSHKGTTLATFTAAGMVRRGLEEVGFKIIKHKGFGHKREMVSGTKVTSNNIPNHMPHGQSPWYVVKKTEFPNPIKRIAVIGAGLAGSATAFALANRGYQVSVFEKDSAIAQQASGNPVGMTFTRLSPFDNAQNRFYQKAYLYAINRIKERFGDTELQPEKDYALNGALRFAFSEKEIAEQKKLLQSGLWPDSIANPKTATECESTIGVKCQFDGLYLTEGGWLTPADLCKIQLSHPNISIHLDSPVASFTFNSEGTSWNLSVNNQTINVDALVLANSFGANVFEGLEYLPLRSVRGQITYVKATENSTKLQHALNYEGYITPAKNGFHCVGATFHPKEKTTDFRQQDHQTNLSNLLNTVPELFTQLNISINDEGNPDDWPINQGRVAFRCQSPDYLPMVGPVPNIKDFKEDYANLRKGFLKKDFPLGSYLPGVYVNLAHGSRGITSSILSAEIISSYINNEPQPIDKEVLEAIHPTRFAIRGLKRNQL